MHATAYLAEPAIHDDAESDAVPLVIEARDRRSVDDLCAFLGARRGWIRDRLLSHGAILLRGFEVFDAPAFERVARAIDPSLKNEYLGTSPRNALTAHVFTASELPPFYPIPQHREMTFVKPMERRFPTPTWRRSATPSGSISS